MSRFHDHIEYIEVDPCFDTYNNYRVEKKCQVKKSQRTKKKLNLVEYGTAAKNLPRRKKLVVEDGVV